MSGRSNASAVRWKGTMPLLALVVLLLAACQPPHVPSARAQALAAAGLVPLTPLGLPHKLADHGERIADPQLPAGLSVWVRGDAKNTTGFVTTFIRECRLLACPPPSIAHDARGRAVLVVDAPVVWCARDDARCAPGRFTSTVFSVEGNYGGVVPLVGDTCTCPAPPTP